MLGIIEPEPWYCVGLSYRDVLARRKKLSKMAIERNQLCSNRCDVIIR